MCGIIGWFSINETSNMPIIIDRMRVLLNRGYDSIGVGFVKDGKIIVSKFATEKMKWDEIILKLEKELDFNTKINNLVLHTRWATHGGVSDINAHPHVSLDNNIVLVHNGVIDNIVDLTLALKKFPASNTDSSIITELIAVEFKKINNLEQSIKNVLKLVHGTWVLIIISPLYPNNIYIARNNTPLIIGKTNTGDLMMVSEKSAFIDTVTEIYSVKNKEILVITRNTNILTLEPNVKFLKIDKNDSYFSIITTPSPYQFWTIAEINQQIKKMNNCIQEHIRNNTIYFNNIDPHLQNIKRIIFFGCGTSYHANLVAKEFIEHHFFKLLDKYEIDIYTYDASGFDPSKLRNLKYGNTLFIFSSQSGETIDLYHIICKLKELFRRKNVFYIGVVNVPGSLITEMVDYPIYIKAGKEHSVASTKSYTNMVICNILLLSYLLQLKENNSKFLEEPVINPLLNLSNILDRFIPYAQDFVNNEVINIIEELKIDNMFVIGNKMDYYVAMEASLKLKEISYIHSEASLGGSLKHGPFALLCPNIIVILIITEPTEFSKLYNAYQEIKARNTRVIILTTIPIKTIDNDPIILIPMNNYSFLLANIVLQLLAYYIAIERNINPDFPRNLAKVVTVQ